MDPEFRWNQNGYGRNEYPHPRPQDIDEAILRLIEKERIREEIIMSEIVRRRVLEAEMRRELMMEREMALLQGRDGFPFGSSPVMGLESPMRPSLLVKKEGCSAKERLVMALEDKEKLKMSENGGSETLSFQRSSADLRISEIKPALVDNIEKERIRLLTKPDENVSGSKTKHVTPPEMINIEHLADVIANKISKEEWSCALCQIMATSEKDLNEHVLGKKHKSKVAALRAQRTGKNYSIGLFPKKRTESFHVDEKRVKLKAQTLFSQKGGKATSKKDDLPLSQDSKSEHFKKTQAEVNQKVQKNEDDPRKRGCKFNEITNTHKLGNIELPADVIANKKSKEWRCILCQVIATSKKDLNEHVLGKKHKTKVAASGVGEKGVKLKAQSLFSREGNATPKKDDLPLSQKPKSEHLKKTQAEVIQKVQKNENDPRKKGCEFSEVINSHKLGNIELPADVNAHKKSKEWRCVLCQVIATSEKDLNEHVLGKKHKSKVAASGESHSIGLVPKKPTKSIHVEEKGVKLKTQSLFSQEGNATSKKDDLPLSQNPKSEHLKKTQAEVIQKVQKNENDRNKKCCEFSEVINACKLENIELPADVDASKKFKEWSCALCQVSATSANGLYEHVHGKKHKLKEAALRSS